MAKFVLQGTIIEEPVRKQVGKKATELVSLKVEEKCTNAFGDRLNVFDVEFFGRMVNALPKDLKLAGAPVVIIGAIRSRDYNGKNYYSLIAEEFSIISVKSFAEMPKKEELKQEHIDENRDISVPNDALPDDDLPF